MAKIKTPKRFKNNISESLQATKNVGLFNFPYEPDASFFYFLSFADYEGKNYPGYNKLKEHGLSLYDIERQDNLKDGQLEEKIKTILNVIDKFEQFEAKNEKALFDEKLKPLLTANPAMYEQFIHIFDDPNDIDYIGFITLLRTFEKDLDAIKANTSNLFQTMYNYNQAFNHATDSLRRAYMIEREEEYSPEQLSDRYTFIENFRGEINDKVQQQLNGIQSNYTNDMFAILTDYKNLIENKGRSNSIYKADFSSLVQDMINTGTLTLSGEEINARLAKHNISIEQFDSIPLKLALIQKLRALLRGRLEKDLYDTKDTLEDLKYGIEVGLKEIKYAKAGDEYSKAQIKKDKEYQEFFNYLLACLENLDIIEKQAQTIDKIYNGGNKVRFRQNTTDQLSGLTKEKRIKLLESLPDTIKNSFGEFNSKAHKHIPGIKEQLSLLETGYIWDTKKNEYIKKFKKLDIRKKEHFKLYIELIKEALDTTKSLPNLMKELNQLLKFSDANARKQTITVTSETGAVLDLHTIFSKTGEMISLAIGSEGTRADSILIGRANITLDDQQTDEHIVSVLDKTVALMKNLKTTEFNKLIRAYNKEYNPDYAKNAYSTKANLSASAQIEQNTITTFKNQLNGNINKDEAVLKHLKDIFVIEDSTKFATTFNIAEGGFKGGSLGGDLIMQIQNINEMLLIGGIDTIDANFLLNAVMNAGPGMLGYKQKTKLEAYFSTIAAVCMFQTGGLALQQYAQTLIDDIKPLQTSTTKIHLFTLGTLHVPLSYILHLVKEGMTFCGEKLFEVIATNQGSQVKIYNPVNEATDKISKEYTTTVGDKTKTFKIGDWNATAKAGLPKVKLDMAIMAGYLNVLKQIEHRMSSLI